ncbi:MAG TPA: alpha-glucosidase C-terminal domain-containing protein, partial [Puia sp.]|nr:alpha-glucosidase C-terminal domain-containing protein [Puia sp.]
RGTLVSYDNNDVCAFTKTAPGDTVFVMVNLRNTAITYTVPANLQNTAWSDGFDNSARSLGTQYSLPAYGFIVLRKQ